MTGPGAGAGGSRPTEVVLQNPNRYPGFDSGRLREWLRRLVAELSPEADSFAARLVGGRGMRGLNRRYRGIDRVTDVLSFPGDVTPEGRHLGDVVICYPVASRRAAEAGRPPERELRRLLLHGVLHCLGYDHERDGGEMRRLERRLRRRWLEADV